jgi:hypothetical protein
MTTTNGNRPILDLKRFEFCSVPPAASAAGSFIASSRHYRQYQLFVTSNTTAYLYLPSEDGWLTLASPALAGTFGVGASGVAGAWSTGSTIAAASLTATGGTTSTIITNQTLARDLRGYSVHILSGPNAGVTLEIRRNTVGANATITVDAQASAFTASTVYRLITPRWYVLGAGTLASGSFKVYDFATNTWTTLSQTGLPGTIGTAGKLVNTPSWINTGYNQFATGTASAATATTISDSTKSWTASQWVNFQVRIVGGTGAGQIRTITASTGTQLTVATWTVTPDATSTYSIEGNDDFLYYMGNNAVTLYRYSISGNSWSTLTPGVARAAAPGTGMSGHWIYGVTDSAWTSESAVINGRRIYSFRGGNGALLDYYDIPSNAWTNGVSYAPAVDTYTAGTKFAYNSDYLYILQGTNGRWFRYSYANSELSPWSFMAYAQGSAIEGDTAFDVEYKDGATVIPFIYVVPNTLAVLLRQMVF